MKERDDDRLKTSLQQAFPPLDEEPARDLWPAVLRRMDAQPAMQPWFDWALLAALVGVAALFPSAIPVVLYYL